jgi:hypothetical protein
VEGRAGGLASPDLAGDPRSRLAGYRWRPMVSPRQISLGLAGDPRFVLFFRPWVLQTHGFFFFLGRGFRMIKSQKGSPFLLGFSFEALETSFVVLESIFEALETIF